LKAAVYTRYGPPDVVSIKEIETPTPKDNEVLIRVHATTVTTGDARVRALNLPKGFGLIGRLAIGISGPRQPILGSELAGVIEAVGKDVTKFKVGDQVLAFTDAKLGCHAEYKTMPEDGALARKPANLSFEEAATLCFGGTTALHFFRKGNLQRGEKILIVGASGGVGTAAVQLAQNFGAEVTGVCSTANVDLVKSLGADSVIDYTRDDFTRNGETYDVIMDTAGSAPFPRCKNSLKENGRLLVVLGGLPDILRVPVVAMTSKKKVVAGPASIPATDIAVLAGFAETGEYKAVIDSRFPFDRIVDAHRRLEAGHKKGNVVVTLVP
jgi:NADPH:quinone reductase-like Zn-dependent oxidoreductase